MTLTPVVDGGVASDCSGDRICEDFPFRRISRVRIHTQGPVRPSLADPASEHRDPRGLPWWIPRQYKPSFMRGIKKISLRLTCRRRALLGCPTASGQTPNSRSSESAGFLRRAGSGLGEVGVNATSDEWMQCDGGMQP